ncbi:MAG: hypothetical protein KJ060_17030, partial [Candidatus Hydrogenedentes bacterium]|nr:hypothetical protein [Candidatus Hydrogenedentota bacterium]
MFRKAVVALRNGRSSATTYEFLCAAIVAIAVLLAGCGSSETASSGSDGPDGKLVVTTTIGMITDVTREIA